jgi:hypothetical protein
MDWRGNVLFLLDQRKLPVEVVNVPCYTYEDVASAIKTMVVRGAPAIGAAAAFGVVLGVAALAQRSEGAASRDELRTGIDRICEALAATRPTAVNLFWAIERMKSVALRSLDVAPESLVKVLDAEARAIHDEDIAVVNSKGSHVPRSYSAVNVALFQRFSVAVYDAVLHFDCVSRDAHDPLDQILFLAAVAVNVCLEHDNIAVVRFPGDIREFIHDQVVVRLDGGIHGVSFY